MITHDSGAPPEAVEGKNDVAIAFEAVSKSYRLYHRPHYRLLDQLGLLSWFKPKGEQPYHLFHALKDVTFTLRHGERIGLIGRNGAGKTTLLKLITDNYQPSSGKVVVNGTIQALMQLGIGFHPEFSGYENIKAALSYNGLIGVDLKAALDDVVDFVELGEFLHQPMKTYSLGMNARVQFAAATAIRPDIVLIDEILGAGDSYFAAKSAMRMDKLAKSGSTVVLVSHSWQQIQQYCQRVVWLRDGRIFMDGLPHEVLAAYEVHIAEETAKNRLPARTEASAGRGDAGSRAKQSESAEAVGAADESQLLPEASEGMDYANVAWVADRIREHEGVTATEEFQDRLSDGHRVFRIPGVDGLRFAYVSVISEGRRVLSLRTGTQAVIEFDIRADRADDFVCSYWIHFFGLDGRRVCRIESVPDKFSAKQGDLRRVRVDLTPFLIGAGEYLLSFSVFDLSTSGSAADTLNSRFEMLARSYQLKIVQENDSDPPIIHYPGLWTMGDDRSNIASVIRSGV